MGDLNLVMLKILLKIIFRNFRQLNNETSSFIKYIVGNRIYYLV